MEHKRKRHRRHPLIHLWMLVKARAGRFTHHLHGTLLRWLGNREWLLNFGAHAIFLLCVGGISIYATYYGPGRNQLWEWNYGYIPQNADKTHHAYHGGYLEFIRLCMCLCLQFILLFIFKDSRHLFSGKTELPFPIYQNAKSNFSKVVPRNLTRFNVSFWKPLALFAVCYYILWMAPNSIKEEFHNHVGESWEMSFMDGLRPYACYLPYALCQYMGVIAPNFLMLLYCLDQNLSGYSRSCGEVASFARTEPDLDEVLRQAAPRFKQLKQKVQSDSRRFALFALANIAMLLLESFSATIYTLGRYSQEVMKLATLVTVFGLPFYYFALFRLYRKSYASFCREVESRIASAPGVPRRNTLAEEENADLVPLHVLVTAFTAGTAKSAVGSVIVFFGANYVEAPKSGKKDEGLTTSGMVSQILPGFIHRRVFEFHNLLFPHKSVPISDDLGIRLSHAGNNLKRLATPFPFKRAQIIGEGKSELDKVAQPFGYSHVASLELVDAGSDGLTPLACRFLDEEDVPASPQGAKPSRPQAGVLPQSLLHGFGILGRSTLHANATDILAWASQHGGRRITGTWLKSLGDGARADGVVVARGRVLEVFARKADVHAPGLSLSVGVEVPDGNNAWRTLRTEYVIGTRDHLSVNEIGSLAFFVFFILIFVSAVAVEVWRKEKGSHMGALASRRVEKSLAITETLRVATWNTGYGGMGARSDFKLDGGRHLFPPSRRDVRQRSMGLRAGLASMKADVYLLQEIAPAQPLNHFVDMAGMVRRKLKWFHRQSDIELGLSHRFPNLTRGVLEIRNEVYSKFPVINAERHPLAAENKRLLGFFAKDYFAQTVVLKPWEDARELLLVNIHLSTFDEGGETKFKQLGQIFDLVVELSMGGTRSVIVGGDWNIRLVPTDFTHNPGMRKGHDFWLQDLDEACRTIGRTCPPGFRFVAPSEQPTVRLVNEPYYRNITYTCTIDGFLVSNDLLVEKLEVPDTSFANSDHNPVVVTVRRAPQHGQFKLG